MKILIIIVIYSLFSACLCLSYGVNLLRTLFYFCTSSIIFLYLFGLFGYLSFGASLFTILCLSFGLCSVVRNWAVLLSFRGQILTLLIFLFPIIYLSIIIDNNYLFTAWDEFSHWARSSKIIYEENSLYLEKSPLIFKHYPPGQQLFQYFFLKILGWSEKNVLLAQDIIVFSSVLYLCDLLIRNLIVKILIFYSAILGFYFFGFDVHSIYSDLLLGVYFGASFVGAINKQKKWQECIFVILSMAVLVLIKEVGLLLSLIVCLAFVVNEWMNLNEFNKIGESNIKKISMSLQCLATILAAYVSWHTYLRNIGIIKSHSLMSLYDFFLGKNIDRLLETKNEFLVRIQSYSYFERIYHGPALSGSIVEVFLIFLAIMVTIIYLSDSKDRKYLSVNCAILFIGFISYVSFLFLAYLIFFSEWEGVRLASFERYISSYLLVLAIVSVATALAVIEIKNVQAAIFGATLVLAYLIYNSPTQFRSDILSIKSTVVERAKRLSVVYLANLIKSKAAVGDKTYFIMQNSTGYEKTMFDYVMLPYESENWCWSLGKVYYTGDVWTCDKRLEDVLDDYKFLAVYGADDRFWLENGYLFNGYVSNQNYSVFEIFRDHKNIKLQEITN